MLVLFWDKSTDILVLIFYSKSPHTIEYSSITFKIKLIKGTLFEFQKSF